MNCTLSRHKCSRRGVSAAVWSAGCQPRACAGVQRDCAEQAARAPGRALAPRCRIAIGCLAVLLTLPGWSLSGQVIYQESFDEAPSDADVRRVGWRIQATAKQSTYIVRDGVLHVTCLPETYKGGYAEVGVPVCRKGVLEFDVCVAMGDRGNARGLALTMDLYNVGLWWHDYCKDWRRYFPEPVGRRMAGFNVEPVGHQSLCKVKKGRWHHYKVAFDTDRDLVEYYMDDMVDPVHIDAGVPVLGRAEWQGGVLRIGNMGITNGAVTYGIDNIVLRSLDEAQEEASAERQVCLVFRGMAFERYRLKEALAIVSPAQDSGSKIGSGVEEVRLYSVVSWRSPPHATNTFKLDRMPSSSMVARARAIVLADMPAGPDDIMPTFLIEQIAGSVRKGARLVVLGGLFALDKGCYRGTPFEHILPVDLGEERWAVEASKTPLPLDPVHPELRRGLRWAQKPCMLYYHALPTRNGAEVLVKAGGVPVLVRRSYGDGEILVFLGTPCGRSGPGCLPFWQWEDWPALLARMVSGL